MFGFKKDEKDKEVDASCEISLTNIFALNNNKATAAAKAKANGMNPVIVNSAISEDGKSLTSAGHHIVSIVLDAKGKAADEVKKAASEALRAYANVFGGPESEKALVDDKIYSLDDEVGADENNEGKEGAPSVSESVSSRDSAINSHRKRFASLLVTEAGKDLISQVVKSRIDSGEWQLDDVRKNLKDKYYQQIKTDLADAGDDPDNAKKQSVDSIQKVIDSKEFEDSLDVSSKKDDSGGPAKLGYYFVYEFKVNGLKETSVGDALKKAGAKILDGVGIKFTSLFGGGGDEISGKDLRQGLSSAFGGIDPNQLVSKFHANMAKKIPTGGRCDVSVYDKNTILRSTKQYLDAQAKKKVMDADYTLAMRVSEQEGRKGITPQLIADVLTASISGVFKKFKNKVTKDDVIVVNNSKNRGRNAARATAAAPVDDASSQSDVVSEAWRDSTSSSMCHPDLAVKTGNASAKLFRHLFEEADPPALLKVDFKYPADPSKPEGNKESFKKDGSPVVIEVSPKTRLGDKDKKIPIDQARQQFASNGYEFIGWMPPLKGDPEITKDTTFVAQYRKQKDVENKDDAGVEYDYYLIPMPGLKYKSEDDE